LITAQVELDGSKAKLYTQRSTEDLNKEIPASRRYMNIIIKAAVYNGLRIVYIAMLKAKKSVYYPIISEIFAIRVYIWVIKRARQ